MSRTGAQSKHQMRSQATRGVAWLVGCWVVGWIVAITLDIALLVPLSPAVGFLIYERMRRTDRLVLWLRKFDPSPEALPIRRLMAVHSAGRFNVITLQDKSYPVSYFSALNRWGPYAQIALAFPIALGLILLPAVLAWVWIAATFELSEEYSQYLLIAFLVGTLVLLVAGVGLFIRRKAPIQIRSSVDVDRVATFARRVRSRSGFNPGVAVFSCDDASWQECVRKALSLVDAVLIDVSAISDNLRWEIKTALKAVPPSKVVLLVARTEMAELEGPRLRARLLGDSTEVEGFSDVRLVQYRADRSMRRIVPARRVGEVMKAVLASLATSMETETSRAADRAATGSCAATDASRAARR